MGQRDLSVRADVDRHRRTLLPVQPGGSDDGSSWSNAFDDLQEGLGIAVVGDNIWVADGTYYPTKGTGRYKTFQMINDVAIYGGFDGTETALAERDVQNNETILSIFNSGKPIPGEMKDSIFEKYKRGKKKRSKYSKGLGLYFCKMAMKLQGGRIWLETAESGNYFHLGFPPAMTPADH